MASNSLRKYQRTCAGFGQQEVADAQSDQDGQKKIKTEVPAPAERVSPPGRKSSARKTAVGSTDINEAAPELLMSAVGQRLCAAIIAARKKSPITSAEDLRERLRLRKVVGFGPQKVQLLEAGGVTFGGAKRGAAAAASTAAVDRSKPDPRKKARTERKPAAAAAAADELAKKETKTKAKKLAKGTPVVVAGLRSAAQHNGKAGHVVGYDADSGRYMVKLADGSNVSIQPANAVAGAATRMYPATGGEAPSAFTSFSRYKCPGERVGDAPVFPPNRPPLKCDWPLLATSEMRLATIGHLWNATG